MYACCRAESTSGLTSVSAKPLAFALETMWDTYTTPVKAAWTVALYKVASALNVS